MTVISMYEYHELHEFIGEVGSQLRRILDDYEPEPSVKKAIKRLLVEVDGRFREVDGNLSVAEIMRLRSELEEERSKH